MTGPAAPTEDEIHAYVDEALDAPRLAEFEAILHRDSHLAARIAAYRADRDALRQALSGIMAKPVPPAWQHRIESAMRGHAGATRNWAIAAGIALFLTAGAGGALLWPRGDGIVNAALAAREDGLRDGQAVNSADSSAQNARLETALGVHVRAPDLQRFGFHLAGLEVGGTHSAQMDYRDARGRRLTIYVRPSNGSVRFDMLRDGASRICVWQDEVVGAVIIAPMPAGEIMRVATSAYSALGL